MKATKSFNNISAELLSKIPKLKPGQVVLFRMLNGVPNPEPDEKERSKSPVLYGKVQIQTNFRLYDPFQKNQAGETVGGYVDVGCVEQWDGDKPVRFRCFIPGQGGFSQFQGKFQLTGGVVADEELYEVLWLSHQRLGNPYRDESVEPLFEMIDSKADSKTSLNKLDILRKALKLSESITPEEARQVMAALNQPDYADTDVLMANFGELARNKPDLVLQTYSNADTPVLAALKSAMSKGIITHDIATGDIKLGGMKIHSLRVDDLAVLVPQLLLWVKTSVNGKDVLANIMAQLNQGAVKVPDVFKEQTVVPPVQASAPAAQPTATVTEEENVGTIVE